MSLFNLFRRGPRPIGTVRLKGGRRKVELWGRNEWKVTTEGRDDPTFARRLADIYSDRLAYGGPSHGHYGFAVLKDVAEQFGGSFTFHRPKAAPGDVTH